MGAVNETPELREPEKLSERHNVSEFTCGQPALDRWLHTRAAQNEASGASRTYVVRAGAKVAGYYSLAAGAVAHANASRRVKRNMPDPVPVMVLARLVVDKNFQGIGLGTGLLRDAVLRTLQAAGIAGIRALLVHAISEDAKKFYLRHGFTPSEIEPMTLMITLKDAERELAASQH